MEILPYFQCVLVHGRPLELESSEESANGQTNFILVDRLNLLERGFDKITSLKDKRTTLEVQFYNEVCEMILIGKSRLLADHCFHV